MRRRGAGDATHLPSGGHDRGAEPAQLLVRGRALKPPSPRSGRGLPCGRVLGTSHAW